MLFLLFNTAFADTIVSTYVNENDECKNDCQIKSCISETCRVAEVECVQECRRTKALEELIKVLEKALKTFSEKNE